MSGKKDTNPQVIVTSTGKRYMATYAGTLGEVDYYRCQDVATGDVVGYAATMGAGKFGPVCKDYMAAALRMRNIAYSWDSWIGKLFAHQK